MRKNKVKYSIIFTVILILILAIFFFWKFASVASKKIEHIAYLEFNKRINDLISDYSEIKNYSDIYDKILDINYNKHNQIVSVDYNMPYVYELSKNYTSNLIKNLKNNKYENNYILLWEPIGVYSNLVFLNNLGPKIPILIRFIDSIYTNVRTKITNYGMNNALLELYLDVSIKYDIITPVYSEENKIDYTLLLSAKVINGVIPNYYGGQIVKDSGLYNS